MDFCLFIFSVFNGAVSSKDNMASNDKMISD
jgi:hypothetical protein